MSSSPLAQTKAMAKSLKNVCFDVVGNSHRESLWIQHSEHILLKCQGYFRILSWKQTFRNHSLAPGLSKHMWGQSRSGCS